MDLKRRQFIKTTFASLGSVAAGAEVSAVQSLVKANETSPARKNPISTDPVAKVKLTQDVTTSRIGFGTGMSGYNRSAQLTRMDRSKALELLGHAYDIGIRYYDCADLYGTHDVVSFALKDKPRDSFQIGSKIWAHSGGIPEEERPSSDVVIKRFLQELKMDYIDLVQIHCMMKPDWREDVERYTDELEELKKKGLIRAHGISCHSVGAVLNGAKDPWVDAMHIRINSTGARMDGSFEENVAAAKLAQDNGKGIIAMKLIGEGTIRDRKTRMESLDKVVDADVVDVYIVGFEELWQIDEFVENMESSLQKFAEVHK